MKSEKKYKILARLDANEHIGFGHAARVAALISELENDSEIYVVGRGDSLNSFFPNAKKLFNLSSLNQSEEENAKETMDVANSIGANILLCDQPNLSSTSWNLFNNAKTKVIAVDDFGGEVRADVIINGTVLESYHNYPKNDNGEQYCGGKYALLAPCFGESQWQENNNKDIVICLGSGELVKPWLTKLIADDGILRNIKANKISIILSKGFKLDKNINKQCQKLSAKIYQGIKQQQLAELLSNHTLAVTTGGMIIYEAMAVGVPLLAFAQVKSCLPEVSFLGKNGSLIDLGEDGGLTFIDRVSFIEKEIKNLFNNPDAAKRMSEKNKNMIDGKGIKRVVEIIRKLK